jgi:hypothetical protein
MYFLSSNVLSVLQCIVCPLRTDSALEDRQGIGGETIHWRRDNKLKRTDNALKDRQYIEEDRQYMEEDRQYISGHTIH